MYDEQEKVQSEINSLKTAIGQCNADMVQFYTQLGQAYYQLFWDRPAYELQGIMSQIQMIQNNINNYQTRLTYLQQMCFCPECGTGVPQNLYYCPKCGACVIHPPVQMQAAAKAPGSFCSKCGAKLPEGSLFCSVCGTKNTAK